MNLQHVTGREITVLCVDAEHVSNERIRSTDRRTPSSKAFADLEGEPFKAYYCATCALKRAAPGSDADGIHDYRRHNP